MFMKLTPGTVVIKLFFRRHCDVEIKFTKDHTQGIEQNTVCILTPFDTLCRSVVVKFKSIMGKWTTTGSRHHWSLISCAKLFSNSPLPNSVLMPNCVLFVYMTQQFSQLIFLILANVFGVGGCHLAA
jgi:hypothetical protein